MRTNRIRALALAGVALVLLAASPAGSGIARGFPDPSFDRDGVTHTNFGSFDLGTSVAVQSDGKILAAGYTRDRIAVARYLANGKPDRSFSKDGKVTTGFEAPTYAAGVAASAGGKAVVVAGHYRYLQDQCCQRGVAVLRLTKSGALDSGFGQAGKVVIEFPNGGTSLGIIPQAVAVLPDGSVIAGGYVWVDPVESEDEYALDELIPSSTPFPRINKAAFWLTKLTPAGQPDPTFGVNGTVMVNFDGGDNTLDDIAAAPDGSIVAAGRTNADPRPGMLVARFLPNGEIDPAFGPGGSRTIRTGSDRNTGTTGVALVRGGAILVSGFATAGLTAQFPDQHAVVVRLRPDGSFDPGFGKAGVTRFQVGSSSGTSDLVATSSGASYVLGTTTQCGPGCVFFGLFGAGSPTVYALTPAGKLIRGFGFSGAGSLPSGTVFASAIALHKGRPLVIGGGSAGTVGQICSGNFCFYAGIPDFDFTLVRLRG